MKCTAIVHKDAPVAVVAQICVAPLYHLLLASDALHPRLSLVHLLVHLRPVLLHPVSIITCTFALWINFIIRIMQPGQGIGKFYDSDNRMWG